MSGDQMTERRSQWKTVLLLAASFALTAVTPAAAQTRPAVTRLAVEHPDSVLYVGNSFFYYNNGLPGHVSQLLAAADPQYKLRATLVAISGAGLNWHDVESYFRPDAIGMYSFDSANRVVFNKPAKLFDVTVLADCSQCPILPPLQPGFYEYAKKHSATVRKHGATPVLFMTWAYADEPQMTAPLAEAYTLAGNQNDALVIPAGLAFARAVRERPRLSLYVADKRHPSVAGTYLAACTVYASLFRKSPVGLGYRATLDADTASFLQGVAWRTVQEYLGNASPDLARAAAPVALAPTGTLRAAYIAANTAQAVQDKASGEFRGVAADIARELGRRAAVPVSIAPLGSAAAVLNAVQNGEADIGFVAPNAERMGNVLYTRPYMRVQQTFLVKSDSTLQSVRELDRAGNTLGANSGDSMALYLKTNFKQSTLMESPDFSLHEAAAWLAAGRVIAFGGSRQRLGAATRGTTDLRLLADNLYGVPQTIAVGTNRPELQKHLDAVLDELRASGFTQRALQNSGVDGVEVASPTATP